MAMQAAMQANRHEPVPEGRGAWPAEIQQLCYVHHHPSQPCKSPDRPPFLRGMPMDARLPHHRPIQQQTPLLGEHLDASRAALMPTAVSWARVSAQTGGLLDWALDELGGLDDIHDTEMPDAATGAAVARPRANRGRLTGVHAAAIFLARLSHPGTKVAQKLAAEFQVSAKAIRDIFTRKTWTTETMPFWNLTRLDLMAQPDLSVASPAFAASAARVAAALDPKARDGGGP